MLGSLYKLFVVLSCIGMAKVMPIRDKLSFGPSQKVNYPAAGRVSLALTKKFGFKARPA